MVLRHLSIALGLALFVGCGGDERPATGGRGASGGTADAGGSAGPEQHAGEGGAPSATGTGGRSQGDAGEPGQVVRLLIAPGGVLLTPDAPEQELIATAYDADGTKVDAAIEWSSSDTDSVQVDADGRVHAMKTSGSALVTAAVGDVKVTVVALAAKPAADAVVVTDADIVDGPHAVDSAAPFVEGYRYRVELATIPPAVGNVLLTSGAKPVAGRVSEVDGATVTLELVPIAEIFDDLELTQRLRLVDLPDESLPRPTAAFKVGPFECEVSSGAVDIQFPKNSRRLLRTDTLTYDIDFSLLDGFKRLEVSGQPGLAFDMEPTLAAELDGRVTCKTIIKEYPLPIPGPAKLFLGAAVVLGAGVEVGGKIPVAGVGINLQGEVSANFAMGAACDDDDCSTIEDITVDASVTSEVKAPELSLKVEPEAQVFLYAELEGGASFTSRLRTEAIAAQAGFKLAGTFASEETQAKEEDYSSKYDLTFEGEVGPGAAVDDFFELIGFALSFLKVDTSIPIASSPTGSKLVGFPAEFAAGDEVSFTLVLEADSVSLPLVGYNVEKVRLYRREVADNGDVSLILANEVTAEPGQTQFDIPWVATVDGSVDGHFSAFVTTSLSDLRLEVGTAAALNADGILPIADVTFGLVDAYATTYPAGVPLNPGATDIAMGRLFYSITPDGILVCSKRSLIGSAAYITVNFASEIQLIPGTYDFAVWDTEITPGTFYAFVNVLPECVDLPESDLVACECSSSDHDIFDGGTLVVEEVAGEFVGTVTLHTPNGNSIGEFSVPFCSRTYEESEDINQERGFECVPPP